MPEEKSIFEEMTEDQYLQFFERLEHFGRLVREDCHEKLLEHSIDLLIEDRLKYKNSVRFFQDPTSGHIYLLWKNNIVGFYRSTLPEELPEAFKNAKRSNYPRHKDIYLFFHEWETSTLVEFLHEHGVPSLMSIGEIASFEHKLREEASLLWLRHTGKWDFR